LDLPLNATWTQNATTVAGYANGTYGASNNSLDYPVGITISNNDILYIADYYNHRIVVVNLTSSTLMRIFGSGPNTTISQFNKPSDVFLIGTSLYVLDSQNYRIQKWSINGTNPSTVPGGGSFDYSVYMYIDNYSSIYVSVFEDNNVIRFSANSSTFVTAAGSGAGTAGAGSNRLDGPYGIYVDGNRTLYIADYNNHRIQMWTYGASSGSTVAGTGTNGTSSTQITNPSSIVMDNNRYMYITDTGNNRIIRWALGASSGMCIAACTGISGTKQNQLNWPASVAVDSSGSLYVADYRNSRVQKYKILNNQG
jgi:hypothetical protein